MSGPRPIGEILAPIVAAAFAMADFQRALRRCASADARKAMILAARENAMIDDHDARLLIEAYQLETA